MKDYIEREAACELLAMALDDDWEPEYAADRMNEIPAADVRPVVRGKWIPDYDYAEYDYDGSTPLAEPRKFQDGWQCSLCGGYMPSETNFCPNCGSHNGGDENG